MIERLETDPTTKLFRSRSLIFRKLKGTQVVFDPDTLKWAFVNPMGKEIIEMCTGERTLSEILLLLNRKYNVKVEDITKSVADYVNSLIDQHILSKEQFDPVAKKIDERCVDTLFLYLTNACNLRCTHCFLDSGAALENELSTKEILRVIEEFRALDGKSLILSGGEPLLRKDLYFIIERAKANGLIICITTNGTLIDKKFAEESSRNQIAVQVSLEGPNSEINDKIRGKGNFKRAIDSVQMLVDHKTNVGFEVTLTRLCVDEIEKIMDLASRLGVRRIQFAKLMPTGRAKGYERILGLNDERFLMACRMILELSVRKGIQVNVVSPIQEIDLSRNERCSAGVTRISISPDGNVYPCPTLHLNEMCCGNVRKQSLDNILSNSAILKDLRTLSVLDIPECKNCEMKFLCGGGCRGENYLCQGRIDTRSPSCAAFKGLAWQELEKIWEYVLEHCADQESTLQRETTQL